MTVLPVILNVRGTIQSHVSLTFIYTDHAAQERPYNVEFSQRFKKIWERYQVWHRNHCWLAYLHVYDVYKYQTFQACLKLSYVASFLQVNGHNGSDLLIAAQWLSTKPD
jgi:hypothetical protein